MYNLAAIEEAADRWKQREDPEPPDPWQSLAQAILHGCAAEARRTLDRMAQGQIPPRTAALAMMCDLSEGLDRLLPHLRHEAAMDAYCAASSAFNAILDQLFPDPQNIDPGLLQKIPDKLIQS